MSQRVAPQLEDQESGTRRRSGRVTESQRREADMNSTIAKIKNDSTDGLEVKTSSTHGKGIFSTKVFQPGEFLTEYKGEVKGKKDGDLILAQDGTNSSAYIVFFRHKEKSFCIDATQDDGSFGRLVNHSRGNDNAKLQSVEIDGHPRVYLKSTRVINIGDEILYDYGETRKEVIESNPWLKKSSAPSSSTTSTSNSSRVIQPVNPQLEVLAPQPAVAPIVPPAVDPIVPPAVAPIVQPAVAPIVQPAVAPIVQPVVAQVVQPAAVEVVPRQQRLVRTRTGRFASKRHRNRVLAQQNPAP